MKRREQTAYGPREDSISSISSEESKYVGKLRNRYNHEVVASELDKMRRRADEDDDNVYTDEELEEDLVDSLDQEAPLEAATLVESKYQQSESVQRKNDESKPLKGILKKTTVDSRTNLLEQKENRPMTSAARREAATKGRGIVSSSSTLLRPTTAPPQQKVQEVPVRNDFKPVYTKAYQESLIDRKEFNYKEKNFKTIGKKTDRVKRFQAMQNAWKGSSFLKNNSTGTREGRKLNIADRLVNSRPDQIFYRYANKYLIL
eukprot:TRINITY_DN6176_c0_g1_i4.p1 TRINITY_DN6176_c0_g1~~TRINITY_DN6176_c0_g1_i4.p1  ORF type:complete len:260 (+),score=66.06 TRINITY_DN6176_c0_g1_i4:123-902(+)